MARCMVCSARKGKRTCPALGGSICSVCCGSKRQNEISCPAECHHLGKGLQYLAARDEDGRLSAFEREMRSIIGNEESCEALLNEIEQTILRTWRSRQAITDRHVEQALDFLLESGKAGIGLPARVPRDLPLDVEVLAEAVSATIGAGHAVAGIPDPMTWLKCIHRVRQSVRDHHHPADERAYLGFIAHFFL